MDKVFIIILDHNDGECHSDGVAGVDSHAFETYIDASHYLIGRGYEPEAVYSLADDEYSLVFVSDEYEEVSTIVDLSVTRRR